MLKIAKVSVAAQNKRVARVRVAAQNKKMSFNSDARDEVLARLRLNRNFPDVIKIEDYNKVVSLLFLDYGCVTNPQKNYRLEFILPAQKNSKDKKAFNLFSDSSFGEYLEIELKHTTRNGDDVFYTTKNEDVFNILTIIGASEAAVAYTNTYIEKDLRNRSQRQVNCEMANIEKMNTASSEQLLYIEKIQNKDGLKKLPEKLREVAVLRLENPDISLRELGKLCNPAISRSAVSHRLQKIIEIGKEF
ncbi:hypothetical protein FACS1894132_05370 [Clostridia bacterium]|nr:hypothetical protein FACS1894132_05370 [Clostridia bacterium]